MAEQERKRRRYRKPEELKGKRPDHSVNRDSRDPLFSVRMDKEWFDAVNGWVDTKTELTGQTKKELILELFVNAIERDRNRNNADLPQMPSVN